jgi:hypothetical protein
MKIWSVTSASNQDASQLERIRRFGKVRPSDQRIKTSGGALPEVAELLILKMLSVTFLVKNGPLWTLSRHLPGQIATLAIQATAAIVCCGEFCLTILAASIGELIPNANLRSPNREHRMKLVGTNLYVNHARVGEVQVARDKFCGSRYYRCGDCRFCAQNDRFPLA